VTSHDDEPWCIRATPPGRRDRWRSIAATTNPRPRAGCAAVPDRPGSGGMAIAASRWLKASCEPPPGNRSAFGADRPRVGPGFFFDHGIWADWSQSWRKQQYQTTRQGRRECRPVGIPVAGRCQERHLRKQHRCPAGLPATAQIGTAGPSGSRCAGEGQKVAGPWFATAKGPARGPRVAALRPGRPGHTFDVTGVVWIGPGSSVPAASCVPRHHGPRAGNGRPAPSADPGGVRAPTVAATFQRRLFRSPERQPRRLPSAEGRARVALPKNGRPPALSCTTNGTGYRFGAGNRRRSAIGPKVAKACRAEPDHAGGTGGKVNPDVRPPVEGAPGGAGTSATKATIDRPSSGVNGEAGAEGLVTGRGALSVLHASGPDHDGSRLWFARDGH